MKAKFTLKKTRYKIVKKSLIKQLFFSKNGKIKNPIKSILKTFKTLIPSKN
jgi:hypothetical protein